MYRVITTNQFGLTARGWVLVMGLFSTCSFWICHPIPQFHKFDSAWRHSSLLYSSRKSKVCCNCLFVRETVLRWPLNRSKDKTRTHWNLWPSSGEWLLPGTNNPERATAILGTCQGVFTDQFIFRHIWGTFSCENRIPTKNKARFKRRATAVPNSVDRTKFDFSRQ